MSLQDAIVRLGDGHALAQSMDLIPRKGKGRAYAHTENA